MIEIMIVLVVSSIAISGMLALNVVFFKINFSSAQENLINGNMREVQIEHFMKGSQADYFVIYESTKRTDRDELKDRKMDGEFGNLLFFVYTEEGGNKINRLVGFWSRSVTDSLGRSSLLMFDENITPASNQSLEDLIQSIRFTQNVSKNLVNLVKGQSDGYLFSNLDGRSVLVAMQIFQGNQNSRVHSFSIRPRG